MQNKPLVSMVRYLENALFNTVFIQTAQIQ